MKKITQVTKTEEKVLNLLSAGIGAEKIAGKLGCSINTVRKHTANIRKKTGLKNAVSLALWWKNGI